MSESKKKILIIDDEPDILDVLAFHFSELGYEVNIATNGEEALKTLLSCRIDLIISDIRMPSMDGIELLKKLVKEFGDKRPYHIFLTGHSDVTEVEALKLGAVAYLTKPVGLKNLTEIVIDKLGE